MATPDRSLLDFGLRAQNAAASLASSLADGGFASANLERLQLLTRLVEQIGGDMRCTSRVCTPGAILDVQKCLARSLRGSLLDALLRNITKEQCKVAMQIINLLASLLEVAVTANCELLVFHSSEPAAREHDPLHSELIRGARGVSEAFISTCQLAASGHDQQAAPQIEQAFFMETPSRLCAALARCFKTFKADVIRPLVESCLCTPSILCFTVEHAGHSLATVGYKLDFEHADFEPFINKSLEDEAARDSRAREALSLLNSLCSTSVLIEAWRSTESKVSKKHAHAQLAYKVFLIIPHIARRSRRSSWRCATSCHPIWR